jgi:phenylalanyl-tRNA synthetase beta chain
MKCSLSWLKEYIPVEMNLPDLVERLTMAGLEVDSLENRYAWMEKVLVSRVLAVAPHPNARKLTLCRVDAGDRQVQVVCGAPNVREGMLAPLALPGTLFPSGIKLEKSVIRGQTSEGMLCSAAELELSSDAGGIMDLDPGFQIGQPLPVALGLSDHAIEIDLTPNRPDCLSMIGVAREIGGFQNKKITYPEIRLPEGEKPIEEMTSVIIESPDHCPRYAARLIEGVEIKPSPFWLRDRLLSIGLRPINNIVDVTNFVMMETGQPLHAFDFDNLEENRIVVRTAVEGERFTTLDEKERTLASDMLMICDGRKPVAVGGVMGGLNSEIENTTTRVLIESAYFDPSSIRKTSRRLGLNTDASHRFERGVDPEGTLRALNRAAQLMLETAGGTLTRGIIDERPRIVKNDPVAFRVSAANRRLGTELTGDQIVELLESIEIHVEKGEDDDRLMAAPPSCRVDISRPEDIMEEVARRWGYNRIPVTFPAMPAEGARPAPRIVLRNQVRDLMVGYGFAEAVNYSFIERGACDKLRMPEDDRRRRMLDIMNPISEDLSVMRTSLIPGLLQIMSRNLAWQNRNLKLFEVGKIFLSNGQDALPDEIEMAAGLWTGARENLSWHYRETPCDFYDLKGVAESLLAAVGISDIKFSALPEASCDYLRPGCSAVMSVGQTSLGLIGEIHPYVLKNYDLKQKSYVFELNLDELQPFISTEKLARQIPRYPSVSRDLTVIVDKNIEAAALLSRIKASEESLIEDILIVAVYEGENIPSGRKSVSFRIVYRSSAETLEDETVTAIHQKISDNLVETFNASFPA